MQQLHVDQPVTYTSPLDDESIGGAIVEGIESEDRLGDDGTTAPIDIYLVRLPNGGLIRCERPWLLPEKVS